MGVVEQRWLFRLRLLLDRWSMSGMIRLLNTGASSLPTISSPWSWCTILFLSGRGSWMRQSWSASTWGEPMWSGSDCCKSRNILDISDLEMVIINMHPSFRSVFKSMRIDLRVYSATYKSTHIRCRVMNKHFFFSTFPVGFLSISRILFPLIQQWWTVHMCKLITAKIDSTSPWTLLEKSRAKLGVSLFGWGLVNEELSMNQKPISELHSRTG